MTRADYTVLAKWFKKNKAYHSMLPEFMHMLKEDNSRFDEVRFLEAIFDFPKKLLDVKDTYFGYFLVFGYIHRKTARQQFYSTISAIVGDGFFGIRLLKVKK